MAFITPMEAMKPMEFKTMELMKSVTSIDEIQKVDNKNTGPVSFEDQLFSAVQKVRDLEDASNKASYDLAVGNTDDTTAVMLAATKAETAIQLTTQITTRAVNAYKEIMQMNI